MYRQLLNGFEFECNGCQRTKQQPARQTPDGWLYVPNLTAYRGTSAVHLSGQHYCGSVCMASVVDKAGRT